MRPAIQVVNKNPPIKSTMDRTNSQVGTSNAILPTMATGDVNGMTDNQKLTGPCGSLRINMNNPK